MEAGAAVAGAGFVAQDAARLCAQSSSGSMMVATGSAASPGPMTSFSVRRHWRTCPGRGTMMTWNSELDALRPAPRDFAGLAGRHPEHVPQAAVLVLVDLRLAARVVLGPAHALVLDGRGDGDRDPEAGLSGGLGDVGEHAVPDGVGPRVAVDDGSVVERVVCFGRMRSGCGCGHLCGASPAAAEPAGAVDLDAQDGLRHSRSPGSVLLRRAARPVRGTARRGCRHRRFRSARS